MKFFTKYLLLSISIIFLSLGTAYAKKTFITVEKDLRKIQITNHKSYIVKTYYEMYHIKYGWVRAICKEDEVKRKNFFKIIRNCEFSSAALRSINNQTNNDEVQKVASKTLNNNNQQEETQEEESQEEETQEEEQNNNMPEDPPIEEECNDPKIC